MANCGNRKSRRQSSKRCFLFRLSHQELSKVVIVNSNLKSFSLVYIRVPALESEAQWRNDPVLSIVGMRQYVDWRPLRHLDARMPTVREQIERFCDKVVEALREPWVSPEERRVEAARLAEEEWQRTEAANQAEEEKRRAAAARRAEEEKRRAKEVRLRAEAAGQAEEEKQPAEAARQAEEEKQPAEAARQAEEESRRAGLARQKRWFEWAQQQKIAATILAIFILVGVAGIVAYSYYATEAARQAEQQKQQTEAARQAEEEKQQAEAARRAAEVHAQAQWQTYTKASTQSGLPHDFVRALAGGADGALWVGT